MILLIILSTVSLERNKDDVKMGSGGRNHTLAQSILLRSTSCSFLSPELHIQHHQPVLQVSETALTSDITPKSDGVFGRNQPLTQREHSHTDRLWFAGVIPYYTIFI